MALYTWPGPAQMLELDLPVGFEVASWDTRQISVMQFSITHHNQRSRSFRGRIKFTDYIKLHADDPEVILEDPWLAELLPQENGGGVEYEINRVLDQGACYPHPTNGHALFSLNDELDRAVKQFIGARVKEYLATLPAAP
jgi:hypothetical protein